MKISVLVPVYKAEKYITRCAKSLFSQGYNDLEYLFVNDCTPDRSVELLQELLIDEYPTRQSQVRIINHEKNRGSAAARNTLLNNATGEFVCWVDADDWLEKDAIDKLVKKQQENDYDIVTGWSYQMTKDGIQPLRQPTYQTKEKMLREMWDTGHRHVLWGRIIRRSLYEKTDIRCTESWDDGEDFFLMVAVVYYSKKIASLNNYVYYYNRINESAQTYLYSNRRNASKWKQSNNNMNKTIAFLLEKDLFNKEAGEKFIQYKFSFLCMAAKHNERVFFQEIANELKEVYKDFHYAIGFNNSVFRFILTHYFTASISLKLRAFFIKKFSKPCLKNNNITD